MLFSTPKFSRCNIMSVPSHEKVAAVFLWFFFTMMMSQLHNPNQLPNLVKLFQRNMCCIVLLPEQEKWLGLRPYFSPLKPYFKISN